MNATLNTFLYHLIESTVWSFLFIGCVRFLKIEDSRLRCWIYRIALLKFLFPSVWFVTFLHLNPQEELIPLMVVFSEPIDRLTSQEISGRTVPYMFYLWATVIGIMFVRTLVVIFRFITKLKTVSAPFERRDQAVLEVALESMGKASGSLKGYVAETDLSIGLFGIFRPRIIAKHEFLEMLNDRELTAAYQHEIAHKERWDNVWRLMIDVIASLLWFHPIIWYLKRKILIETEKACDEQVILSGQSTSIYANCLLKAAEYAHSGSYFCSVGLLEASIKIRVSNVIHYEKGNKTIMKTIIIVLTAFALISGSFTLLAATDSAIEVINDEKVYQIELLDVRPRPTRQVAPKYPKELKIQGINGQVNVRFIVSEEGNVSDIEIVDPKPSHVEFIATSVEALLKWKFSPGLIDGKPVKVFVRAPLVFKLTPSIGTSPEAMTEYLERVKRLGITDPEYLKIYDYAKPKLDALKGLESEKAKKDIQILADIVHKMVKERGFIERSL